jgi:hypothetical protein
MKDGSVKSDVELAWCVNETRKHESCGETRVIFLGDKEYLSRMHDRAGIYTPKSRLIDTRYLSR